MGRCGRPTRRRQRVMPRLPRTWGAQPPWRLTTGALTSPAPAEHHSGDPHGSEIERAIPFEGGGASTPPATSVNPEALDTLVEALRHASVVEEHRTLMGMVVEKIQSAKSGLNEAFTSLLTGFEVCDVTFLGAFHVQKNMHVYR